MGLWRRGRTCDLSCWYTGGVSAMLIMNVLVCRPLVFQRLQLDAPLCVEAEKELSWRSKEVASRSLHFDPRNNTVL